MTVVGLGIQIEPAARTPHRSAGVTASARVKATLRARNGRHLTIQTPRPSRSPQQDKPDQPAQPSPSQPSPSQPSPSQPSPSQPSQGRPSQGRSNAPGERKPVSRAAASLQAIHAAGLAAVVRTASEHAAGEVNVGRVLPVLPELRALLPGGGLRRGALIAVVTAPTAPNTATVSATAPTARVAATAPTTTTAPTVAPTTTPTKAPTTAPTTTSTKAPTAAPTTTSTKAPTTAPTTAPTAAQTTAPTTAQAPTSLMLALLAAASQSGSWCGVVGVPTLGAVAAAELGLALDRLALVPYPGAEWATVVAALLDGLDIVVAAPPGPIAPAVAGRLAARARQHGSVLVAYGSWRGADVMLESVRGVWNGLGDGRGRLRSRELTIRSVGRGAAAAARQVSMWLPGSLPEVVNATTLTVATGTSTTGTSTTGTPAATATTASTAATATTAATAATATTASMAAPATTATTASTATTATTATLAAAG